LIAINDRFDPVATGVCGRWLEIAFNKATSNNGPFVDAEQQMKRKQLNFACCKQHHLRIAI
jgi:hypothetical protein